ncbi:hypothetical protein CANARDRAFT_197627 [[Candida] arabinofermentans NRRL YB-2248]|uniref:Inosine triphosphate pyrophosphatase n=1 Tax=[Candida] arabinofermentans NRRL YB-2248 TaxID=983967 RepID=A0A1E4T2R7_9ASCO|nr:hypothetical protein CANARDRAFT_197627 [[Candida] arabinofermentans NRRL YB-2248]
MSTITFVTGNANKLKEVVAILSQGGSNNEGSGGDSKVGKFTITNQNIDLDELQGTLEEVTIHKTKQACKFVQGAVLVEDTSLGFDAMQGLPGPYIKWFVKSVGLKGLNQMLDGFQDRSAKAVTTFGYCEGPGCEVLLFQGITEGTIVESRGPTNFGWDSIFEPKGTGLTYAEMRGEEKNKISHRSKALAKLKEFLLSQ